MHKAFFETKKRALVAMEQLETKMNKVKCYDKENEIVKKENEESGGLTFLLQDLSELYIPFLSCFKSFCTNYKSSHQDLFNCC